MVCDPVLVVGWFFLASRSRGLNGGGFLGYRNYPSVRFFTERFQFQDLRDGKMNGFPPVSGFFGNGISTLRKVR